MAAHQVFHHRHQKTAGAARRVAHGFGGLGVGNLHHQTDDVARGAELTIDAGGGELREQVFVEVALDVALGERQGVDHVDRRDQQRGLLDHQLGVLEVLLEGGLLRPLLGVHLDDGLEVGEDLVAHHRQHILRPQLLEAGPAQRLLVVIEDSPEGFPGARGALFIARLCNVEHAREHQEGYLLDNRERIGDAPSPELLPEFVDSAFEFACDHTCVVSGPLFGLNVLIM